MIKNYIFDFGNVLANFYPDKLTEPFVENEETNQLVREVVFDRLYWDKLDSGDISDEEVKEKICARLPENLGKIACRVYDNWINTLTPVKNMTELVYDIYEKGGKLFLISNISAGFAENYKKVPWINELLSLFDGLVFSATANLVKPDKAIFEYVLNKYGLKAEECLFIDDSGKNISGAESAGINGYLFDGDAEKLRFTIGE